jgi:hypothetical protein
MIAFSGYGNRYTASKPHRSNCVPAPSVSLPLLLIAIGDKQQANVTAGHLSVAREPGRLLRNCILDARMWVAIDETDTIAHVEPIGAERLGDMDTKPKSA